MLFAFSTPLKFSKPQLPNFTLFAIGIAQLRRRTHLQTPTIITSNNEANYRCQHIKATVYTNTYSPQCTVYPFNMQVYSTQTNGDIDEPCRGTAHIFFCSHREIIMSFVILECCIGTARKSRYEQRGY